MAVTVLLPEFVPVAVKISVPPSGNVPMGLPVSVPIPVIVPTAVNVPLPVSVGVVVESDVPPGPAPPPVLLGCPPWLPVSPA
jgi:hypothetical protein